MNNCGKILYHAIILIVFSSSCEKFVDPGSPKDGIDASAAYSNDVNAAASVTGILGRMAIGTFANGASSFSILCGLSADEFSSRFSDISRRQLYTNSLLTENASSGGMWSSLYNFIYSANGAIEGLEKSPGVTAPLKKQLTGESKFFRAFCYFYLVNLFGDVPLTLSTDYRENRLLPRTAKALVYQQIVKDLKEAQELLSDDYLTPGGVPIDERVRPNKAAATALLARVYLYTGDWVNAEAKASILIDNKNTYELVPLNEVFLKNSKEAIWQLQSIVPGYNTFDAFEMILISNPLDQKVSLSKSLLNSFEKGDVRRANWVGAYETYNYAYKYKVRDYGQPITEYLMVLRLAEQYLIRAEARIQSGNIRGGVEDLNIIRARARAAATPEIPIPLPAIGTGIPKENALLAVEHERQIELFTEWGHRWLDLKRTSRADKIMINEAAEKGAIWKTSAQLYPIPRPDINTNPNLKPQNPGYN